MPSSSERVRLASGRSFLLTTRMSAISRIPALIAWMSSPSPGAETTILVWASSAISTSAWPAPTVSTTTTSLPAASITSTTRAAVRESPPRCPREASERTNTASSPACSCMRMRSPRMAPPENGLEGSTATTPTLRPRPRSSAMSAPTRVDLPDPVAPVTPITSARPRWGKMAPRMALASALSFSTAVMARASTWRSPARSRESQSPRALGAAAAAVAPAPLMPPPGAGRSRTRP